MDVDEDCGVVVEVLDSSEIPEDELNDFTETVPLKLDELVKQRQFPSSSKNESEEELITKYVQGKVSFPDCYTTLQPGEENDDCVLPDSNSDNASQAVASDTSSDGVYLGGLESRKEKRPCRRRTYLSAALQGLMGEANLCFVRGQIEMTEKICLEIIRQNPLAPEPFFTLAQIYETKDAEKFLHFSTIAAHLDPTNRDQWIRIAELNIEKGNRQQARVCYSKAIAIFPKDYDLRFKKAELLANMNEKTNSMFAYLRLIPLFPKEKGEFCLSVAKNVAKYFHAQQKMGFALQALQGAYGVVPNLFSIADLNLLLELLMINKNYSTVLTILQERSGVELVTEPDGGEFLVVACSIPDDLISDFRVKLCVSLIHLKTVHLLRYIVNNIIEFIPPESGVDWYVDIAEALMNERRYSEAIDLLSAVIGNSDFSAPAYIWLRYAECHRALGKYEDAITAYYEVIELAPYCFDAKFTLSALLKQQGRHREAIKALEQDLDSDTIEPRLLYERCLMLKSIGEIDQYLELGYILLARNSIRLKSREELQMVSNNAYNSRASNLKNIIEQFHDSKKAPDQPACNEAESNLSLEDEFNLFKDLAEEMYKQKKFGSLQKLCFAIVTTKKFRPKIREMVKILTVTSYYNDDGAIALSSIRETLSKNLRSNCYWNMCNLICQKLDSANYYKYLKRLFARQPFQSYFKIVLGNYHLAVGSYKYALNVYVGIFKDSQDPLVAFLIAVVFAQLGLQKNMSRKPTALSQANAFMKKYSELRMSPLTQQEIYYNMGRLYHQIGMSHLALHWYNEVLRLSNDTINQNANILDLKPEAAFNIHLIYKAAGNLDMARKYLYDYIVV